MSKRPANTAFKQQQLRAWQPILTPKPVIATFIALGIAFLPIGIALYVGSSSVIEVGTRYDEVCNMTLGTSDYCVVDIKVEEKMEHPVYLYYRMENYYQNHRRYVKSRNDAQLRGDTVDSYSSLEDCDPIKSKDDSEDAENFFLPCVV